MKTSSILTIAGVSLVAGAVAYAAWFDSKRRNDASFRKKLRKEKKKVEKTAAAESVASVSSTAPSAASLGPLNITEAELRVAIEKIKTEPLPPSPEEKEQYFMQQVNIGETLCAQGPAFSLTAAMSFFRALRVYPSPVELLMIYQQTVPEPVFKLVVDMTQLEMKARVEGYWDHFPPKNMNVSVKPVDIPDASGTLIRKRILVASQDFKAGDVIYTEDAVVAALDADLEGTGAYCTHCFRATSPDAVIRPPADADKFGAAYCSKACELASTTQSQGLLFGASPVPASALKPGDADANAAKRSEVQDGLVAQLRAARQAAPLLLARLYARQVSGELHKMFPGAAADPAIAFGDSEFTFYDHMERLRYLELAAGDDEAGAFRAVLENVLPGLAEFVTDDSYNTLKGKIHYNAFGVYYGEGRDDKPDDGKRPEDQERTRCPVGTARQIGSAFYFVSSYSQHNCDPNARAVFADNATLQLTALRDIAAGEEITVSYVDAAQRPGEVPADARRRRRQELARGWRFACPCARCAAEAPAGAPAPEEVAKDESRVEAPLQRRDEMEQQAVDAAIE